MFVVKTKKHNLYLYFFSSFSCVDCLVPQLSVIALPRKYKYSRQPSVMICTWVVFLYSVYWVAKHTHYITYLFVNIPGRNFISKSCSLSTNNGNEKSFFIRSWRPKAALRNYIIDQAAMLFIMGPCHPTGHLMAQKQSRKGQLLWDSSQCIHLT